MIILWILYLKYRSNSIQFNPNIYYSPAYSKLTQAIAVIGISLLFKLHFYSGFVPVFYSLLVPGFPSEVHQTSVGVLSKHGRIC